MNEYGGAKVHFDELEVGDIYTVNCSGVVQRFKILSIKGGIIKSKMILRDGTFYKIPFYTNRQEWQASQEYEGSKWTEWLLFKSGDNGWKEI